MEEAYKKFTWLFPVTLLIIFAFISIRFGALFIPLKLFFTVVMPIAMVYGILTGVYQHGWLDSIGITSLKDTNGVYWMLPVMTATILVGFALDYEIFLFSRVWEYRSTIPNI